MIFCKRLEEKEGLVKGQGKGFQGKKPYPKRLKPNPKGFLQVLASGEDMFSLFQRKRVSSFGDAQAVLPTELPQGMTRPESAASLLAPPHRQKLLEAIWQRTSLSRAQFSLL